MTQCFNQAQIPDIIAQLELDQNTKEQLNQSMDVPSIIKYFTDLQRYDDALLFLSLGLYQHPALCWAYGCIHAESDVIGTEQRAMLKLIHHWLQAPVPPLYMQIEKQSSTVAPHMSSYWLANAIMGITKEKNKPFEISSIAESWQFGHFIFNAIHLISEENSAMETQKKSQIAYALRMISQNHNPDIS